MRRVADKSEEAFTRWNNTSVSVSKEMVMKKLYLITGATGHVGNVLVDELKRRHESIRILVHHKQRDGNLPEGVDVCFGDVTDRESLLPFFNCAGFDHVTLIHCAAFITVASKQDLRVWKTNVNGTENTMELALSNNIDRVVYVSSVHAIPERPVPEIITEVSSFSPDLVHGQYAKSKAAAAQIVMEYANKGLNVSIVHPSGIIGPGDVMVKNHMIRTIRAMEAGRIPVAIQGGYDFVDSRDVADGILSCEEYGFAGECYILNGHYISVKVLLNRVRGFAGKRPVTIELPYRLANGIAPAAERVTLIFGKNAPLFTPYSVYTLHTNGAFSHDKAYKAFGYCPREIDESIRDSL